MAERRPVVLVGGQLKELPSGETLPAQAPALHSHAAADVTGLETALSGKEPTIAPGAAAQYWRGDKSWRDFFTDVRAATLAGLSTATNAVITASDTVLTALGKLQKQVSDTQATLSSKLNATNPAITGTPVEDVYAITDGASVAIDPANGSIQTWTLGASRTPSATNFTAGNAVTLMIDDGSAYSVVWSTIGVVWLTDSGSAPTLKTSGYTPVVLWKVGTTIYGR